MVGRTGFRFFISTHSSGNTSFLNVSCKAGASVGNMKQSLATCLEDIDTLASDVADDFVLVVEVSPKHLGGFVHGMLNFDGDSSTSLRLLDNLEKDIYKQ